MVKKESKSKAKAEPSAPLTKPSAPLTEAEELKELKEKMKTCLEDLIKNKFPKKVMEIKALIAESFDINKMTDFKPEVNIPIPAKPTADSQSQAVADSRSRPPELDRRVFLFPNGVNGTNEPIQRLIDRLKPLLLDFATDLRHLKFAIELMVPTIEDGNNLGVDIQKATINELESALHQSLRHISQMTQFYISRGNTVAGIARYPHCQDYRQCLIEEDQRFYLTLCLMARHLRDRYVLINDLVLKNLDKIKNPRPDRSSSMY